MTDLQKDLEEIASLCSLAIEKTMESEPIIANCPHRDVAEHLGKVAAYVAYLRCYAAWVS